MSDAVIQVENLAKTYKEGFFGRKKIEALRGVTFEAPRGEIFGLLGPNGAGKTTLIKLLLGIARRTGGSAKVLGEPAGTRSMRKRIGYLPENHRIPRHLSGNTAMEYYGCLSGLSIAEVRQRRPELLEAVGLGDWGTTPVRKYSKGMQQRLGLAQSMLHKPELIILDEPTDGVDPVGRKEIRQVLKRLAAEGTSIFLNSHLLQEVELVCDRVVILFKGQVQKIADISELTKISNKTEISLAAKTQDVLQVLRSAGLEDIDVKHKDGKVIASASFESQQHLDKVVDVFRQNEISIESIGQPSRSLEDAFINIIEESR